MNKQQYLKELKEEILKEFAEIEKEIWNFGPLKIKENQTSFSDYQAKDDLKKKKLDNLMKEVSSSRYVWDLAPARPKRQNYINYSTFSQSFVNGDIYLYESLLRLISAC